MANPITIDAMGLPCPIPVVKTKQALGQLTSENTLEVHVDNEIAVQNLTKMAKQKKLDCASEKTGSNRFVVTIRQPGAALGAAAAAETAPADAVCVPDSRRNTVVAIGSNRMGSGDDTLGALLMRGFLYALASADRLPASVLFYNGGAALTTASSESLDDIRSLEAQGVEILTCGTCLNHFGLADQLEVGGVTNMYTIMEKLLAADSVVRP